VQEPKAQVRLSDLVKAAAQQPRSFVDIATLENGDFLKP
jgi:hypothetical protein